MLKVDRMLACLARELALRNIVYPRQIANAKLTQAVADRELLALQEVIDALTALRAMGLAHRDGDLDSATLARGVMRNLGLEKIPLP